MTNNAGSPLLPSTIRSAFLPKSPPTSLPHESTIHFGMASTVIIASSSSSAVPSSSSRSPLSSSSSSSSSSSLLLLPNWTRLGGGGGTVEANADDANCDATAPPLRNVTSSEEATAEEAAETTTVRPSSDSDSSERRGGGSSSSSSSSAAAEAPIAVAPPAYSTPGEASAAYRCGLLKSDPNVSGRSIRVAFRYVSETRATTTTNEEEEEEDEEIFLCWVRADGVPFHFRAMRPVRVRVAVGGETGGHGNLRGGTSSSSGGGDDDDDDLLVNERDHVETTFPGHAFAFCRRAAYDAAVTSDDDDDGSRNEEDARAVHDDDDDGGGDGNTYFLRKKKRRFDRNNDEGKEEEEEEAEWESFLVVGGFRPGPSVAAERDGRGDSEGGEAAANDGGGAVAEEEGDGGDGEGETEGSDDGDSCCDWRDLRMQLVTIRRLRRGANDDGDIGGEAETTRENDNNDVTLPSGAFGCSDCAQSVPCLRGAMNPRTTHAPAFVATTTRAAAGGGDGDIELPLPPPDDEDDERRDQTAADTTSSASARVEEFALEVDVRETRLDPTPLDTSSKVYEECVLGGWPCRVEPGCFPLPGDDGNANTNDDDEVLLRSRFASDLAAASSSLPPSARDLLLASTPVWINASQRYGPRAAPVRARDGCFHPGAEWLVRNGMSPAKRGGVEWYDARHYAEDRHLWGLGGLMLHELSHAWHCLHVEDGYDNADVRATYDAAMEEGLYDCVEVHGPQGPRCRAYACQDPMEYFAELSVAFLGGVGDEDREHNKWYPFNRRQVREHDPRAFAMLCRVWGVEDDGRTGEDRMREGEDTGGEGSRES